MKQTTIILMILCCTTFSFGQKFMIKYGDTLLYKESMAIQTDTVYFGDNVYYPGDTLYEGTCQTFEKIKGKIVNQSDNQCLRQGLWIIPDSSGSFWTGYYQNNHEVGIWKRFTISGKLLNESEEVSFGKDTYKVKEIDYTTGSPITIVNKPFLAFYIKNLVPILMVFFLTFFGRVFINSRIYNIENGTNFSPIYLFFAGFVSKNFEHSLLCTFTLWFFNYKPECRRLVIISNILSGIALIIFFGILFGLAVTGEL